MAQKWWVLAAVCTGVSMLLLDVTIVNVALPSIERGFSASLSDLQWVISAYALTLAAFLLTAGSLADRYGRRLLFSIGLICFTLASLCCGLSTGSTFLVIARAVQGVGGAVMFATSLALLAEAFRGKDRGVAFGLFGAITGAAIALGPVLGGAITSGLSWRWIFFVNLPIGIAALFVTVSKVPESKDPRATRPDLMGFVTFGACLACLVFALIDSSSDGWSSVQVLAPLAASGGLFVAFATVEVRSAAPMLDLGLLRVPTFNGGLAAAFAISAALYSLLTYLVIYVQNVLGLSPLQAGIRFLPLTAAIFLTAGVAGRLTNHVPRRLLIGAGFVLIGAGLLLMRGITAESSWTHLIVGMIVSGVGAGLVNVPLVSTAVGVVDPSRAGMASGINNTLRQVGLATGVAALGTIFASRVRGVVVARLDHTALAGRASSVAHLISSGGTARAISAAPGPLRSVVATASKTGFVDGLNLILLVGAIVAFVAALTSIGLIREKDFIDTEQGASEPALADATA